MKSYEVVRDTREQENNGWIFTPDTKCLGTVTTKLDTGDYTLKGFEKDFIIERKGRLSEWAHNINEKRFEQELERLESFKWPFIILEFTMQDLMNWPKNCGIPKEKIKDIKVSSKFILMRTNEIMIKYKTKIIFAGLYGKEMATSLFKRVMENGRKECGC
jgi:methyltransferase-like protein